MEGIEKFTSIFRAAKHFIILERRFWRPNEEASIGLWIAGEGVEHENTRFATFSGRKKREIMNTKFFGSKRASRRVNTSRTVCQLAGEIYCSGLRRVKTRKEWRRWNSIWNGLWSKRKNCITAASSIPRGIRRDRQSMSISHQKMRRTSLRSARLAGTVEWSQQSLTVKLARISDSFNLN